MQNVRARCFCTVARGGYQSLGSFHSDDVEAIVGLPSAAYSPPALPFDSVAWTAATLDDAAQTALGAEFRRHYLIDFEAWTFLNHGAFGGTLRPAFDLAAEWRRHSETQPLRYFDRELLPHLARSVRSAAEFSECDPTELVLCANATAGLNAAVRGAVRAAAEAETETGRSSADGAARDNAARSSSLVMFDTGYGAVKTMARRVCAEEPQPMALRIAPSPALRFIGSGDDDGSVEQDWSDAWAAALGGALDGADADGAPASVVIVDHVTSNTALALPLERLAEICSARGVRLVVDGAHGLLCEHVEARTLLDAGVFAYVSNAHKWLSAPKAAAVLCVKRANQRWVRPAVLSHGAEDGFLSSFIWDGARDYTAALTLPFVFDFWRAVGVKRARGYCDAVASSAATELARHWRVGDESAGQPQWVASPPRPPLTAHCMRLIPLPAALQNRNGDSDEAAPSSNDAKAVQDALHAEFAIEVPIKCVGGGLHARVSAHVYNELADFERLADAIGQLAARK